MNRIIPLIILISFLTLFILTVIYISRRFAWTMQASNVKPYYFIISLVPILFISSIILLTNSTNYLGHIVYKIALITTGIYLFALLSLLAIDSSNIFLKLSPTNFGRVWLIAIFALSIYGYIQSSIIQKTHYNVPIENITDQIKIAHLSDVHIGHFRNKNHLNRIVKKTNEENPDFVVITGDYLDSKFTLDIKHFSPLQNLNAPVYFVNGNHDNATDTQEIEDYMRKVGVNVLHNQTSHYKDLEIIGLSHMAADNSQRDVHTRTYQETIKDILPKLSTNNSQAKLLLHHSPNGIKYANKAGINLYLTGHTHAGQLFPFNIATKFMFEYYKGINTYKETTVIVSEGIGTFGPPFRLGSKSEIIFITLSPENK